MDSSIWSHLFELSDDADSISQQHLAVAATLMPGSCRDAMLDVVHSDPCRKHTVEK